MSKARLVLTALLTEGQSVAEITARYGVHRSWIYRLKARYDTEGETAFQLRSRRPYTSPRATPPEVAELVLTLRKRLADQGHDAGAETIAWQSRLAAVLNLGDSRGGHRAASWPAAIRQPLSMSCLLGRWHCYEVHLPISPGPPQSRLAILWFGHMPSGGYAVDTYLTVLLDRLEKEATGRGVSDKLFAELKDARPDPSVAAPFIVGLAPLCSPQGRFGVAELAVNLLKQDRGFRPAVRAVVAGYHFDTPYVVTLQSVAKNFADEDYLWWFDLFCEFRFDTDGYFYRLLTDRFPLLMQHRRQEVIDYLADPDLGPGGANVDAVTKVLNRLGRCPPLEDKWSRWIGDGRFIRGAAPGNEGGGILGLCLQAALRDSPAAAVPLINQAIEQWRALLVSGDLHQRQDLMQTMAHMISDRATLGGRLPQRVAAAQQPGSPERDLIEQAFASGDVMPLLEYGG